MKIFDTIQLKKPRSSVFDLSHERKMTLNMGDLVPCLLQEVIPGDKFRVSQEHLIRMHPMLAPLMHRVDVYTHYFFVPNRIIWKEFEDFITGGEDGKANPVFPTIGRTTGHNDIKLTMGRGQLADYLGFPSAQMSDIGDGSFKPISALPFRAYQTIYNEYYRDQNLIPKIPVITSSGNTQLSGTLGDPTDMRNFQLKKRAWEKDYFTSALPFAQRGDQLSIPLSGSANIVPQGPLQFNSSTGTTAPTGNTVWQGTGGDTGYLADENSEIAYYKDGLKVDMEDASASTINELRQAFSIQKWLEKNARGGSRYIEQILTHFGIRSSDARLQRPEYLGGGKNPIIVSEVLQQSETASTPLGTMAGHGISVGKSNQFSKRFEEHGFVMGIMSVLPRTAYYQGLPKIFKKFDKFDYYWPDFAHLGEQEVKQGELYYNLNDDEKNQKTFGYQPRYTEYRFMNDTVHGDFTGTLEFWHMARKFENEPALNADFVQSNPDNRIFPVPITDTTDKLLVQTYTNFKAIRPVAKYGNPGGI
ncbi:MAG: major capsid protein [Sulfolobaceae archaeon]